jgi:hypothetical protein
LQPKGRNDWNLAMTVLRQLILAAILVLLACGPGCGRLDRRTRGILSAASRVESFRLDGKADPLDRKKQAVRRMGGFPVIAQGKDQGPKFAARLAALLADQSTYNRQFREMFLAGCGLPRLEGGRGC